MRLKWKRLASRKFFSACIILSTSCWGDIEHAMISVHAVDCHTGKVIFSQNCDLSMTPASCLKLITTAAALKILGPESRFETQLEHDGFIDHNKILQGNLSIRGGGDPCLGSDRVVGSLSWRAQIETWADSIQQLGIVAIEGRLLTNESRWEKARAVPSWAWEDLGNYYGAGAGALAFNENAYAIFFRPSGQIGAATTLLRSEPPLPLSIFENEVTTGPEGSGDRACIYGTEKGQRIWMRGTIPKGVNEFAIKGSLPDPGAFCVKMLEEALLKRGILVRNKEIGPKSSTVISATYSPKIADIVYWTNQKSVNLYAEHLLKKMGEVVFNTGSTREGIQAVTQFLEKSGIDVRGFHMADGSGLSRINLVTARQIVDVLVKMRKSELFPLFNQSLPERDGGVRAKSGSMFSVRSCAGYQGNIAFAILINHCADSKAMQSKITTTLDLLKNSTSVIEN